MKARPKTKALKLALIGTQRVGKTSILNKFHYGTFEKNTIATVGASFIYHTMKLNGLDVSFQIWDTAGQERYRSLGPIYYRDASCAIAVFDLTSRESFEEMKIYINEFKIHCTDYCHIAIIGNKVDLFKLHGGVDIQLIEKWSKNEGFSFHQTSAFSGEGVSEAFYSIAENVSNLTNRGPSDSISIDQNNNSSKCC